MPLRSPHPKGSSRFADTKGMFSIEDIKADRVWGIGDTHFGHNGIVIHCQRPGWTRWGHHDFERHNQLQVDAINERVAPSDHVLHFGDVARDAESVERWCSQLNGQYTVLKGNHDDQETLDALRELGWTVLDALTIEWTGPVSERSPKAGRASITARCTHWPLTRVSGNEVNFHGHTHGNPSGVTTLHHVDMSADATWGFPRLLKSKLNHGVWLRHATGAGKDMSRFEAKIRSALEANVIR
jgi:calcineurin-like phosphoesterase family protein